eukprot:g2170.t1
MMAGRGSHAHSRRSHYRQHSDCADETCSKSQVGGAESFQCKNGQHSVPVNKLCDLVDDCGDKSDESAPSPCEGECTAAEKGIYLGLFVVNLVALVVCVSHYQFLHLSRSTARIYHDARASIREFQERFARVLVKAQVAPGKNMIVSAGGSHYQVPVPQGVPLGGSFVFQVPAAPATVAQQSPPGLLPAEVALRKSKAFLLMNGFVVPLIPLLLIHGSFLGACDDQDTTIIKPFCITGLVFGTLIFLLAVLMYCVVRNMDMQELKKALGKVRGTKKKKEKREARRNRNVQRHVVLIAMLATWSAYLLLMIVLTILNANGDLFEHYPEPLMRQLKPPSVSVLPTWTNSSGSPSPLLACCAENLSFSGVGCNRCICTGGPSALFDANVLDAAAHCFAFAGSLEIDLDSLETGTVPKLRMISLRSTVRQASSATLGAPLSQFELYTSVDRESWTRLLAGPLQAGAVGVAAATNAFIYDFYFGGAVVEARFVRLTARASPPQIDMAPGSATESPTRLPTPSPTASGGPAAGGLGVPQLGPYFGLGEIELYADAGTPGGTIAFTNGGWTIHGNGRVSSKTSFNLLGGSMEWDMDVSGVKDGVNTNFYTSSPAKPNCGGACYCDIQKSPAGKPSCMELDFTENNGRCALATTLHTFATDGKPNNANCDRWGCASEMKLPGTTLHFKADVGMDGTVVVSINGVPNDKYNTMPSQDSKSMVINTMKSIGAVIESSQCEMLAPDPVVVKKLKIRSKKAVLITGSLI